MPGPSTLLHGFADVLDATSMCLKVAVVILACCCICVLEIVLRTWREVGDCEMRRGAAADALVSIYLSSAMEVVWRGGTMAAEERRM